MLGKNLALAAICFIGLIFVPQMALAEQIAIEWYSGSSYIPSGQSTGTITFKVTSSGLTSGVYYGYAYKIDNGGWSDVQVIGYVTGTSVNYFNASLGDGSHTIYVRLVWYDGYFWNIIANNSTGQTMYYTVTVQNSYGGGNVKVDGTSYSSPATFYWHNGQNHTLTAFDGATYGGLVRRFDNWSGPGINGSGTEVTATISGSDNYTANFHIEYQVTFRNSYPGYGNGGVINVNSTQYNSPTSTFGVAQNNSITGGVVNTSETINHVIYTFSSWSPGGSTQASTQFTPTGNTNYTANFTAKPEDPTNVQAGAPVGEYVAVSWTDNPNTDVTQYRIWRKTKYGSSSQVATVNSGVGSWTDPVFKVTGTGSDSMLTYTVYAYYSPSGTLSDGASQITWATYYPYKVREIGPPAFEETAIPTTFAVGNYPNPFNPSTTISYQLAKDASVKLEIYDVMGRKVRTLLDESRSVGYYSIVWNSRDEMGREVASGMYLYRFVAMPANGEKAFRQSGKLVLTR